MCLADNDIIHKLAACDLLNDAFSALDIVRADIYVLPSAKYKLCVVGRRSRLGEQRYGREGFARIRDFLTSVREIDVAGSPEVRQLFDGVDGIDPGEAVLFSAATTFDSYLLMTGDKASLRALASTPICNGVAQRIRGHVVCLEQIVKHLIQSFGFPYVRDKIVIGRGCDAVLNIAFGSRYDATEPNVLAALDSYINELRSLPVDLLT